jgi:hypothetical protein
MTTIEQGTTAVPACPAWCQCCTPESDGGYGHIGDDREIELSLMPPRTGEDILHRRPWYRGAKMVARLEQPHRATLPVLVFEVGPDDLEHEFTMTIGEAMSLVEVLERLISEATASVFARAEGVSS